MITKTQNITKRKKWLIITINILAIFTFTTYQILLIILTGGTVTLKGYLTLSLEVVVYLLSLLWLFPRSLENREYILLPVRLLALILSFVLVRGLIIYDWKMSGKTFSLLFSKDQLLLASLQLVFVLPISFIIGFYRQSEKRRLEVESALSAYMEAVKEKDRIKATMYQMQLSPHLMFNTLTAIKAELEDELPNIAIAAGLLGEILHHSLVDLSVTQKVDLMVDISTIKKHIDLYYFLGNQKVYLRVKEDYAKATKELKIPPGLLITIMDNIFKYGVIRDKDFPADISIKVKGPTFMLSTSNYIRTNAMPGAGLGLNNLRVLLNYFYPQRHELNINKSGNYYSLKLHIEL